MNSFKKSSIFSMSASHKISRDKNVIYDWTILIFSPKNISIARKVDIESSVRKEIFVILLFSKKVISKNMSMNLFIIEVFNKKTYGGKKIWLKSFWKNVKFTWFGIKNFKDRFEYFQSFFKYINKTKKLWNFNKNLILNFLSYFSLKILQNFTIHTDTLPLIFNSNWFVKVAIDKTKVDIFVYVCIIYFFFEFNESFHCFCELFTNWMMEFKLFLEEI